NTIIAEKRPVKTIDYGFVGDVKKVNANNISALIMAGFVPVFCALTHDTNGQILNTNADTVASEIAIAMSGDYEVELLYCFELQGVLRDVKNLDTVITDLNTNTYAGFLDQGIISDGMLPKLENCFYALNKGVSTIKIGNTSMISSETVRCTTIKL
ncbi:MAG: acetylglutamate kinase, partial [Flavobacteriaceae bacterium]